MKTHARYDRNQEAINRLNDIFKTDRKGQQPRRKKLAYTLGEDIEKIQNPTTPAVTDEGVRFVVKNIDNEDTTIIIDKRMLDKLQGTTWRSLGEPQVRYTCSSKRLLPNQEELPKGTIELKRYIVSTLKGIAYEDLQWTSLKNGATDYRLQNIKWTLRDPELVIDKQKKKMRDEQKKKMRDEPNKDAKLNNAEDKTEEFPIHNAKDTPQALEPKKDKVEKVAVDYGSLRTLKITGKGLSIELTFST